MTAIVTCALILLTNYLATAVPIEAIYQTYTLKNTCASNTFDIDVINKCIKEDDEPVIFNPPNFRNPPYTRPNQGLASIARSDKRQSHLREARASYKDITLHRCKLSSTVLLIIILLFITLLSITVL